MSIDLTTIETAVVHLVELVLLGILGAIGRAVLSKLHLQLAEAQRSELDAVAERALAWATSAVMSSVVSAGWNHAQIKSAVISDAASYAVEHFPDAMRRAGVTSNGDTTPADALQGVLSRKFPEAAARTMAITAAALKNTTDMRQALNAQPPVIGLPR